MIEPHGGSLINRVINKDQMEDLTAKPMRSITLDSWANSDVQCIGIGAFSPLTGFMNKEDYQSVVRNLRLADGTIWSLPITLPVSKQLADHIDLGEYVSLRTPDHKLQAIMKVE